MAGSNVRFGSKADICGAPTYVCFTPDSDRESTLAKGHVRFTPESGRVRCGYGCRLWAKSGHPIIAVHASYFSGPVSTRAPEMITVYTFTELQLVSAQKLPSVPYAMPARHLQISVPRPAPAAAGLSQGSVRLNHNGIARDRRAIDCRLPNPYSRQCSDRRSISIARRDAER